MKRVIQKFGRVFRGAATAAVLSCAAVAASAQNNPFEPGWVLNAENSALRFQSIKNTTKVESSSFATFTGLIDPDGTATIRVLLDSVDTKVDLRNVRMRFLLFETFRFPEAVITMKIEPDTIADLSQVRRKVVTLPYQITLHGVTREQAADIAITLLDDSTVSVASAAPISLAISDFALEEGIKKLEEAANVQIVPSATVTFDFMFNRDGSGDGLQVAAADPAVTPAAVALEAEGDFTADACVGRFEILSRTGNINFAPSSALLDDSSTLLLDSIVDIVSRCPGLNIEIAGHTDADGGASRNQVLSEKRAEVVREYLVRKGIQADRLVAIGYGEARPAFPNDTAENKRRNRRIEFSARDL